MTVNPKLLKIAVNGDRTSYMMSLEELAEILEAGGDVTVTVDSITDATEVGKSVLKAEDQQEARSAIGAGTSNLELGTTDTAAAKGDHTHSNATTTTSGFISSVDQTKLDSISQTVSRQTVKPLPDTTYDQTESNIYFSKCNNVVTVTVILSGNPFSDGNQLAFEAPTGWKPASPIYAPVVGLGADATCLAITSTEDVQDYAFIVQTFAPAVEGVIGIVSSFSYLV